MGNFSQEFINISIFLMGFLILASDAYKMEKKVYKISKKKMRRKLIIPYIF